MWCGNQSGFRRRLFLGGSGFLGGGLRRGFVEEFQDGGSFGGWCGKVEVLALVRAGIEAVGLGVADARGRGGGGFLGFLEGGAEVEGDGLLAAGFRPGGLADGEGKTGHDRWKLQV